MREQEPGRRRDDGAGGPDEQRWRQHKNGETKEANRRKGENISEAEDQYANVRASHWLDRSGEDERDASDGTEQTSTGIRRPTKTSRRGCLP